MWSDYVIVMVKTLQWLYNSFRIKSPICTTIWGGLMWSWPLLPLWVHLQSVPLTHCFITGFSVSVAQGLSPVVLSAYDLSWKSCPVDNRIFDSLSGLYSVYLWVGRSKCLQILPLLITSALTYQAQSLLGPMSLLFSRPTTNSQITQSSFPQSLNQVAP